MQNQKHDLSLSPRLKAVKILRDIFASQDSHSLKSAFDGLNSGINICEETLESDFNRYFVGPFSPLADPFSSVYLDDPDVVMSKSTLHVRTLYETMGFTFPLQNKIPEDHLGIELDAYYQLLYIEEVKKMNYLFDLRNYFLHEHLNQWVPQFIAKALKNEEFNSEAIVFILHKLKSLLIRETNTQGVPA